MNASKLKFFIYKLKESFRTIDISESNFSNLIGPSMYICQKDDHNKQLFWLVANIQTLLRKDTNKISSDLADFIIVYNKNKYLYFSKYMSDVVKDIENIRTDTDDTLSSNTCQICYYDNLLSLDPLCAICKNKLCITCYVENIANTGLEDNHWKCPFCRSENNLVSDSRLNDLIKNKKEVYQIKYLDVINKIQDFSSELYNLEEERSQVLGNLDNLDRIELI